MRILFTVAALIAMNASAFAHEYWFECDNFFPRVNESTNLRLFVGEALKKEEERPFQAAKTDSFQMFSGSEVFDVRSLAEDSKTPVLKFASDHSGTFLLSMERNWSYIKLDAAKFEDYLREDGMEYIVAERKRLGESAKEGRERYSRYIKTLIQVGDSRTGSAKTRVGSKLEIVPLENPYSKKAGDNLKLQVYFAGAPMPNKVVFADNRDGDKFSTQKFTTDANGRFTVKLTNTGVWLIRLVHMQRCVRNCGEADWESFWAALSYGMK